MKPPFAYFGGKTRLADRIAALLPPHRVYIEPFLGSGAVLFAKTPSRFEIANDLDDRIVNFFRVLRERPDELEHACRLTPHARTEFELSLEPSDDPLEDARRMFVRINQSFAKTARGNTGWSITTARTQSVPASMSGRIDRFAAVAARLQTVSIENCDAVELLERFAVTPDVAVYCDPPYLADVRVGRVGNANDYRHDMGTETEHRRLAAALHATPAAVLLSGYDSDLYRELYGDWHRTEFQVTAHASNGRRHDRTPRIEVLWSNRPIAEGQTRLAL